MAMSRSLGVSLLTTRPPIAISPPLISSSPAIMRSSVDLPQPEGPTSTVKSPSGISTLTPRITWVVPNCFWTFRIWTLAISSFHDDIPRAPGLGPIEQVLRGLAAQLPFAFHRIEGGVRSQQDTRMPQDRIIRRRRLGGKHIERRTVEPPRIHR